jgi:hypothetical protein
MIMLTYYDIHYGIEQLKSHVVASGNGNTNDNHSSSQPIASSNVNNININTNNNTNMSAPGDVTNMHHDDHSTPAMASSLSPTRSSQASTHTNNTVLPVTSPSKKMFGSQYDFLTHSCNATPC